MSDFRPRIVKNAVEIYKLSLTTPCPSAQGKFSKLIFKLMTAKNQMNPRFIVYTNDPADQNDRTRGQITANLDLPVFFTLVAKLRAVAASPEDCSEILQNTNYTFPGGKRSAEPSVVGEIRFGKKDGVCWISILDIDQSRPKIKFEFMPSRFHRFVDRTGADIPKGKISPMVLAGYCDILSNLVIGVAIKDYDSNYDPKAEEAAKGGGNRGNFGGGNKPSYQNNKPAEVEQDFDF